MFLIVGIGLVILVFIAIGSGLANAISKQGYPQFLHRNSANEMLQNLKVSDFFGPLCPEKPIK
jgi:hypothetical protein